MAWKIRSDFRRGMLDRQLERAVDEAADAWVDESKRRVPSNWKLHDNIRQEEAGRLRRRVIADPTNTKTGDGYAVYQEEGTRHTAGLHFFARGRRAAEDVLRRARLDR